MKVKILNMNVMKIMYLEMSKRLEKVYGWV